MKDTSYLDEAELIAAGQRLYKSKGSFFAQCSHSTNFTISISHPDLVFPLKNFYG